MVMVCALAGLERAVTNRDESLIVSGEPYRSFAAAWWLLCRSQNPEDVIIILSLESLRRFPDCLC